jgi:hypothetical protein
MKYVNSRGPGRPPKNSGWATRKGDKRKTIIETGWHSDPRIRACSLVAKWLYLCLWDIARAEMREILPDQWTFIALAHEVGSGVTAEEIENALRSELGHLIEITPDGRFKVKGIKQIHSALQAWKDDPNDPDLHKDVKQNAEIHPDSPDYCTVRDGTGRDGTGLDSCPESAAPPQRRTRRFRLAENSDEVAWDVPRPIKGLQLYELDERLCVKWPELLRAWKAAYPGVSIVQEVKQAHAWEVSNSSRRKVDRPRFLGNWLRRAQDKPRRGSGKREHSTTAEVRQVREDAKRRRAEMDKEAKF